jgi:hypothetical protein
MRALLRNRAATALIVAAAIAVPACRKAASDAAMRRQAAPEAQSAAAGDGKAAGGASALAPPAQPLAAMFAARKLIRTAQIGLEVTRFDDAALEASRIAEFHDGYVAESAASNAGDGVRAGTLTLRLPADRFSSALGSIRKIGKVTAEQLSTEDVSLAYADLETRLAVKREAASRLREILRGRTAKLTDILEVEQALSAVVEEIERMEGQRRFWDNQAALSTIRLAISEPSPLVRRGALAPVGDALRQSVSVLVSSVATLLTLGVAALPWALLVFAAFLVIRRTLRRRASRREREARA